MAFYSYLSFLTILAKDIKTDMTTQQEVRLMYPAVDKFAEHSQFCEEIRAMCKETPSVAKAFVDVLNNNLHLPNGRVPENVGTTPPRNTGEDELISLRRRLGLIQLQNMSYQRLIDDIKLTNKFLIEGLTQSKEENEELEDQLSVYAEIINGEESHEANVIRGQELEIVRLRRLVEETKRSKLFAELQEYVPERSDIVTAMKAIYAQVKRILPSVDNSQKVQISNLDHHESLKGLLQRSVGHDDLSGHLAGLQLDHIVSAVAVAALCDWVFFADYENTTSTSLLLDKYRKHLEQLHGVFIPIILH
jgi:hypothetical protein